jgi:hypothetical protein
MHNQGKHTEAFPLAEWNAALACRRRGEENTKMAAAVAGRDVLYKAQGRYPEAKPLGLTTEDRRSTSASSCLRMAKAQECQFMPAAPIKLPA